MRTRVRTPRRLDLFAVCDAYSVVRQVGSPALGFGSMPRNPECPEYPQQTFFAGTVRVKLYDAGVHLNALVIAVEGNDETIVNVCRSCDGVVFLAL